MISARCASRAWLVVALLAVVSGQQMFCCLNSIPPLFPSGNPPLLNTCSATGCAPVYASLPFEGFYLVDTCDACTFQFPEVYSGVNSEVQDAAEAAWAGNATCCVYYESQVFTSDAPQGFAKDVCTPVATCFDDCCESGQIPLCGFLSFGLNSTGACAVPSPLTLESAGGNTAKGDAQDNGVSIAGAPEAISTPFCCYYAAWFDVEDLHNNSIFAVLSNNGCAFSDLIAAYPSCILRNMSDCYLEGFTVATSPNVSDCIVPANNCSHYSGNCVTCNLYAGCDYCFADQTCRSTSEAKSCPAAQLVKSRDMCATGPCVQANTSLPYGDRCAACASQPNCGYCPSAILDTCLYGNASGPTYGGCNATEQDWFVGRDTCPTVACPARSALNNSCAYCVENPACSYCPPLGSGACQSIDNFECASSFTYTTVRMCQLDSICQTYTTCDQCTTFGSGAKCGWCATDNACHTSSVPCTAYPCPPLPPSSTPFWPRYRGIIIAAGAAVVAVGIGSLIGSWWRRRKAASNEERQRLVQNVTQPSTYASTTAAATS